MTTMANKSTPFFPTAATCMHGSKAFIDSDGYRHSSAHQAILTDTLDICACGDHAASIDFLLEATSVAMAGDDTQLIEGLSDLVGKNEHTAADLVLHWLYEEHLIAHGSSLAHSWVDTCGIALMETGDFPVTCTLPDPVLPAIKTLVTFLLTESDAPLQATTAAFLRSDLTRAARLIIGFLVAREIIEPSDEPGCGIQLSPRGLQMVGIDLRRKGFLQMVRGA